MSSVDLDGVYPFVIEHRYYKHPRLMREFIVSIAGACLQFIIAIVFAFITVVLPTCSSKPY